MPKKSFYARGGRDPYNSIDTYGPHVIILLERDLENAAVDRLIRRAIKHALPVTELAKLFAGRERVRLL